MVADGKYTLTEDTTVRFQNCISTFLKGHEIEIKATDDVAHKQLVDFGDRMIDWFYEGSIEQWVGVDYPEMAIQ